MTILDEAFADWIAGAFTENAHKLDPGVRMVAELAFFQGAAQALAIVKERGPEALTAQFAAHLQRLDHILDGTVKL